MQYDQLKEEIKKAMKAHDKTRLSILRQVHGEIKNIEVNERREITEPDVDAMIKRLIKQTSETLEGSIKAGNNEERTEMLRCQVAILEEYLPEQISGDKLVALVEKTINEVGPPASVTWARSWVLSMLLPAVTSIKPPLPKRWAAGWHSVEFYLNPRTIRFLGRCAEGSRKSISSWLSPRASSAFFASIESIFQDTASLP